MSLNENYEQLGEVYLETNSEANVTKVLGGTETINLEETKTIPLVLGERDILKVATTFTGILALQGKQVQDIMLEEEKQIKILFY